MEMGPSHDDNEESTHSIIREGTKHEGYFQEGAPEDDGSKYFDDTSDGSATHLEEIVVEDVRAEVYGIRAYI